MTALVGKSRFLTGPSDRFGMTSVELRGVVGGGVGIG
jgi:hypothetical protein